MQLQAPIAQSRPVQPPGLKAQFNKFFRDKPALVWQLAAGLMGGRQALPGALAGMPQAIRADQPAVRGRAQRAAWNTYVRGDAGAARAERARDAGEDTEAVVD